ncbi:MAG: NusG domain II-containing protein [Clostridiales bacterium]|nr:NusG domain II-containing protein [Clostridiales bacterium]MCD7830534.1 NusG domain II-containing protein [Clostridiales bacterium]
MRNDKTPSKKRYDLLLLAALVLVGLGLTAFVLLSRMNSASDGLTVTIRQDNEVVATLPLDEDATYAVQGEDGGTTNLVVIEDGTVHMEEADCPDQLCVKQGKIRYAGDSLICLPNRVVVEISGEDEQALDAVAK